MKLSVIIVNYNVRYFLEQCLLSVKKAMKDLNVEVFVVDNQSVDGSVEMVAEKFAWAKLIANQENTGFSRANNQAMRIATGEYFLLLNPDTVVEEDTFRKVIDFMDAHLDAGGLGVKMVDGKGRFLPESKRGLPTPETSFYKIFGISRLFPHSKKFNRYYLGHLSNEETHEIEILSGAFMLMRKKALDEVGLLDEAFFMYGEDIDLSWRIIQGGYKNYYLPDTRIIHYKGESTKKGSLNYVFVFYNAMVIFAKKHFSEQHARLFGFFINLAIYLRAGVAISMRFIKAMALPLFDVAITFGALWLVKDVYGQWQHKVYMDHLVYTAFAVCSGIWLASNYIGGAYDKPILPKRVVLPSIIGALVIVVAYSFLPESLRFSRAIILGGSALAIAGLFAGRMLVSRLFNGHFGLNTSSVQRIAIVGSHSEIDRVQAILGQTRSEPAFIVRVSPDQKTEGYFGGMNQLSEIMRVHELGTVIFCAKDVASSDIISAMSSMNPDDIEFKIAPPESLYIIGSNSVETSGDVFILDVNSVSKPINRRLKRLLDVKLAFLFLVTSPLLIFIQRQPIGFVRNISEVLVGQKTWVGFHPGKSRVKLPVMRKGVLHPLSNLHSSAITEENIQKLNSVYAKDYRLTNDLSLVASNLRSLGL